MLCSKPESVQEMRNWNLQFAQNLLTINARHLQPEMLYQTADRKSGVCLSLCLSDVVLIIRVPETGVFNVNITSLCAVCQTNK